MTKSTKNLPVAAAAAMRLDKWLWAARFYKTRSLATDEIDKGRINVNAQCQRSPDAFPFSGRHPPTSPHPLFPLGVMSRGGTPSSTQAGPVS